jgi:predicted dehydrogenase
MLKTAIIGLGDIASVHLAAIASMAETQLIAACDVDEERRSVLPATATFYTDYRELLRREKPDVVHICLPHYLHYTVARDVAEAGFHIFSEKPLALNYEDGLDFSQFEQRYGVKICICLQNRLNPTTERLMELIKGGQYGAVTGVRGVVAWRRTNAYYEAKPWRGKMALAGGGNMINQALHTLDLMQYLAGSEIKRVKGSISQLADYGLEVEDTAVALIGFANGATGLFTGSNVNSEDVPAEIEVSCEKAIFTIRYQTLVRREKGVETVLAEDVNPSVGKTVYGNCHEKLIARFYGVLEGVEGEYIHPRDALPVTRLIDLIRASSETGKTVFL